MHTIKHEEVTLNYNHKRVEMFNITKSHVQSQMSVEKHSHSDRPVRIAHHRVTLESLWT